MSTLYFNLIAIAAEAISTSKQPAISAYINQTVTTVMLSEGQLSWLQIKYNAAAENKVNTSAGRKFRITITTAKTSVNRRPKVKAIVSSRMRTNIRSMTDN